MGYTKDLSEAGSIGSAILTTYSAFAHLPDCKPQAFFNQRFSYGSLTLEGSLCFMV